MKKILLSICSIAIGLFIQAQVAPTIFYVDEDATGAETGFTWADAFTELHEAIDSAISFGIQSGNDPIEIWIAEGSYKPKNQTSPFDITQTMKIYGGFNGTETVLSQRDFKNNLTIIEGDLNGDDSGAITLNNATRQDNAYCLFKLEAESIVIDGLIIQGAHGDDFAQRWFYDGSAIFVGDDAVNSQVSNCIVRNNAAQNNIIYHRAGRDFGGGSRGAGNFVYNEIANNFSGQSILQFEVHSTAPGSQLPDHTTVFRHNLVHSNTIVAQVTGSLTSLMYLRAFNQNSGTSSYVGSGARHFLEISHNTFANNSIPTNNGHVIRHRLTTDSQGGAFPTQIMSITDNIFAENNAVNLMYWDSVAQIKKNSQAIFARNLVQDSDTVSNDDLGSFNPLIAAMYYNLNPGFTDAANDDYTIVGCDKPGNDLGGAPLLLQALEATDFYGNPRVVGTSADIGHAEIQDAFTGLTLEQVGSELVATPGLEPYTWANVTDPQNPIVLPDTTNTITPTSDGDYAVIVEGPNGCFAREDIAYCGAVQVSLSVVGDSIVATGTGGDTYTMRFEGTTIPGFNSSPNNVAPLQGYGQYQVSHFIAGGGSCTATDELLYCGDIPNISISSNGTSIQASVSDANNYAWYLDGVLLPNETDYIIDLTNGQDGEYYVVATANACTGTSNTLSYCANVSIAISESENTLTATSGLSNYQWYLNGVAIAGATNESYTAEANGDYYCETSDNGCTATSNVITVTGISTSIRDIAEFENLNVYPNPASDWVMIESNEEEFTAIRLMNLMGQVVLEKAFNEGKYAYKLQLNALNSGIYLLEITNIDNHRSIVKLALPK